MGWFEDRFRERPTAVARDCEACGRRMWLPPSKVEKYKTCGGDCAFGPQRVAKRARQRPCETCGSLFTPRRTQITNGGGRFCSQKCNKPFHRASQAPDVWERRIKTMREKRARGEWTILAGENAHQWKGGTKAYRQRYAASGRERENARKWREKNPDKVREFCRRRRGRLLGRLAPGTVALLRRLQRNRCAICRERLRKFHVDHIVPISKGGPHAAHNVQLLCPTCNMQKSDRDPIEHMRSLGKLL